MISLFVLPVLLASWNVVLKTVFVLSEQYLVILDIVILLVYVAGLILMKVAETAEARYERSKLLVLGQFTKFEMRSFKVLRKRLGERFTDEYLDELITRFPDELAHVTIKGGLRGVRIVMPEGE